MITNTSSAANQPHRYTRLILLSLSRAGIKLVPSTTDWIRLRWTTIRFYSGPPCLLSPEQLIAPKFPIQGVSQYSSLPQSVDLCESHAERTVAVILTEKTNKTEYRKYNRTCVNDDNISSIMEHTGLQLEERSDLLLAQQPKERSDIEWK